MQKKTKTGADRTEQQRVRHADRQTKQPEEGRGEKEVKNKETYNRHKASQSETRRKR
jgi:hypothetical protein